MDVMVLRRSGGGGVGWWWWVEEVHLKGSPLLCSVLPQVEGGQPWWSWGALVPPPPGLTPGAQLALVKTQTQSLQPQQQQQHVVMHYKTYRHFNF